MSIKRMPAALFVEELRAAAARKDGYIMGATGQDPRKWSVNSWWYTQYTSASQRKKALYWREHAARVWDCNGLAEGLYKDYAGVDINTKARYNYAQWCDPKGKGLIPIAYRVPGAAVFWGTSAANIHHVAYLDRPVMADNPSGDWYLIEARGVMYGVVRTRLSERKPDFWGWMTKYFDYDAPAVAPAPEEPRDLQNGDEGEDVKQLQTNLIRLGYSCGRWGADGDFGDATELAVKRFQETHGIGADGICGPKTRAALEKALAALETAVEEPKTVRITGGSCYVRSGPGTSGTRILAVVHKGDRLPFQGETRQIDGRDWYLIEFEGVNAWVSSKFAKVV